jgi:hypothetical protein
MAQLITDKITEIYYIADDFCKDFSNVIQKQQIHPNDGKHLRKEFPNMLSYNRFVELERKVMIPFVLFLKLICFGKCTGITFIDSTKIAVCKNKRIKQKRVFKDIATVGKSTMGWFYGFKLHLVVNDKGEPD